jgi:hypothetical protein
MPQKTALIVLLAVALAGCGSDQKSTSAPATTTKTTTATTTATTPTTTSTTTTGIDTLEGASTNPVTAPATNKETALLTAVRAARHEGYDRLVFEFANAVPGYDVRYVKRPVREDASGRVVELNGDAVVRVRMENALDADLTKSNAPRTYQGPNRFSPGTPEIAELARAGGFEGVLTWVAGLRDQVDFRVTTLTDPPRLVIDFRNH